MQKYAKFNFLHTLPIFLGNYLEARRFFMQVQTINLVLSRMVFSTRKKRSNAIRGSKSNKQHDAVLVEVSKNMVRSDPEEFAILFDKFRHISV